MAENIQKDCEEGIFIESQYKFETIELSRKTISQDVKEKPVEESEVIPMSVKLFYSIPSFSKMGCLVMLSIHAILFYENLGANILYLSFFVSLARAIEILLKPIVAHFSDIARLKLGRRRPFILIGMPFYAIFFVLIFSVPKITSSFGISLYFGIFYVLFFVADTVCNIPYYALGPELSSDSREREKLFLVLYVFQYMGILFSSGGPVIYSNLAKICDCNYCNDSKILDKIDCANKCKVSCELTSNHNGLLYLSVILGLIYVFGVILLSITYQEKKKSFREEENNFIVPKFFRILNNVPFIYLLIPWILDMTISTIFATMLPFFLSVIINPQKYCIKNKIDLNKEMCYANTWLGYVISIFFICCILSMLMWHSVVRKIGKKKSWCLYSLISLVTFSSFLLCEEGSYFLLISLSILNSIPAGGAYLNDVFLSDIIEYDEFISGQRNEGLYTVFATFIPKLVSIFAQSIPLTIMGIIGFVSSKNGQNMAQPDAIPEFIRFYFIGIPILLAVISFCFKLKYPIDNENLLNILKESIELQKEKAPELKKTLDFYKIKDPIMLRYTYQIFLKNRAHYETKIAAEHFNDWVYLNMLYRGEYEELKQKITQLLFICILVCLFFLCALIITFSYLETKSLSFIPILSLMILAIAIIILVLNSMRYIVMKKVISGEFEIDKEFLRLLMIGFKASVITERSELEIECHDCFNGCMNKKQD